MRQEGLRLSQLVTGDQVKNQKLAQMHKLGNSLRRSSTRNEMGSFQAIDYESRMPQVGFGRKDLSLILRYLFYKQEMHLGDRNLLRRILISTFDEEVICAGSKKFIHFLRLLQGRGNLKCGVPNKLYFLLKGRGTAYSCGFAYSVQPGKVFGHIEILIGQHIDSIEFECNYLLLTLAENEFNTFFRDYFDNLYQQRRAHLRSIDAPYLTSLPPLARHLLLDRIQYRDLQPGQTIVQAGQPLTTIFFLEEHSNRSTPKKNQPPCLGLLELLRNSTEYQQSFTWQGKKVKVACLKVEDFTNYVLDPLRLKSIDSPGLDATSSFLSLNSPDTPKERPKLSSFMRRRKVKISLGRSRLKSEMGEYSEVKFKFLKGENLNSTLRSKRYTEKRLGSSLQRSSNSSYVLQRM